MVASRLTLLILVCLLTASGLGAAAPVVAQPEISGDTIDHDLKTGETIFKGHAVVVHQAIELSAAEVRYNTITGVARATGQVVLTTPAQRILADELEYRYRDGSFSILRPRIGQAELFLQGSSGKGDRNSMELLDATVSYREPAPWTPSLSAKRLSYTADNSGTVQPEGASIGIGHLKPFGVPSFRQRIDFSLKSYLANLNAGYRGTLGVFIDAGLRLPLSEGLRVGADVGLYSSRGYMAGPAAEYSIGIGPEGKAVGSLHSGYINDFGDRRLDILGRRVSARRDYVAWEHRQRLSPALTLEGVFNLWSDSEVLRDFKPQQFFPVQAPDSYLEGTYTFPNLQLSVFGRFQPNGFHQVQERLPELRADLLPRPLALGIYQRLQASYALLREDPLPGAAGRRLESNRSDLYYALTRNFSPVEWGGLTAIVGGRVTDYEKTVPGAARSSYTRTLGEFGVDAQLQAAGTFDVQSEIWKINGLRHLVVPKISYRYIPEAEKGRRYIPPIDRMNFTTYLPPLGLGDIRAIDDLHRTNTLRFAVENTLQTRDADYGSRDLASVTLANDLRFDREAGQHALSDTHLDLALMPARWLRFDLYQSVSPRTLAVRELNTGLTLRDGEAWSVRLATHYLAQEISEYVLDYEQRLNEVYSAVARWRYDLRRSRFNEQTYGIRQNLGNVWDIAYQMSLFEGPRREGSFEFRVEVRGRGF
jgi:LPS-assembly protein